MSGSPFGEILATWIILSAVTYGIGAGILRAAGVHHPTGNAVVTMVIGWGAWMAAAQLSRFFVGAHPWGLAIAAVAAVPGYVLAGRRTRSVWRNAVSTAAWIGAGAWFAALSLRAVPNYDTGLYHYDMVRWAQAYALIPGLANVHDRLGFNSTIFVFAAMVDRAPLGLAAHVVVAGFFAWLWAGWVAIEIFGRGDDGQPGVTRVFALASLPVLVEWAASNELPGLGSDIPVACFLLIVTGECLRVMPGARSREDRLTALATIGWMATAATTVKLSAVGMLGGVAVVFVGSIVAAGRRDGRSPGALLQGIARPLWVFGGLGVVNLAAWVGGNLILSGYPVYPVGIGGLPVDWRVPTQAADAAATWVRSWARLRNEPFYDYLAGAAWLTSWRRTLPSLWVAKLIGVVLFIAAATYLARRARHQFSWGLGAALVPVGASLAYWFVTAPDPRFSGSGATVALAGATALLASELPRAATGLVLAALVAVAQGMPLVRAEARRLVAERGFWRNAPAALPSVTFEERLTDSGLRIAVPRDGAQSSWGQRLLASHQFNPKLALRDPADLGKGFYVTDPTFLAIGWPWQRNAVATIDDRTYGTLVSGGGGVDDVNHYRWFQPPVRMIVYSLDPRAARLQFKVAHVSAHDPVPALVTVFAGRRKVGEFALVEGAAVDLRFTLDRGFNQILFAQNWGEDGYRFAAVKTPAGTVFGCAGYHFTAANMPPPG